jgi:hypothetical protein
VTRRTLTGPGGLLLVLDSAQIFPDDPGQGTPAMVHKGRYDATFWCALDTGELDCGGYELSDSERLWLEAQEPAVSEFMEANTPA